MSQDRDHTRTWALLLALGVTGCAADPPEFGATSAGPTRSPSPAAASAPPDDAEPAPPDDAEPTDPTVRQDRSLCGLFTTREVSRTLGLAVEPVEVEAGRDRVTCTWRASRPPRVPSWRIGDPVLATDDGIVTVTRAPAAAYRALEREITAAARRENADAREEVPGVGLAAFAIGSSVSGVPIWQAMALHGDVVTAVEVTGADSRAGLVTVTGFLAEVVARG